MLFWDCSANDLTSNHDFCSKPGAAAMSTWLSNQTIGLDPDGYGKLLGQASFTSSRVGSLLFEQLTLIAETLITSYLCAMPS